MSFVHQKVPKPNEYLPTVFDNHTTTIKIPNTEDEVVVNLWDTAGQEAYDVLRTTTYEKADLFLICASVLDPNSFGIYTCIHFRSKTIKRMLH